ncbi:MAG: hypothetical protein JJU11_13945 [Candidatus Sumerlaeia bacterium]|nr:hypothetical protein [Candidatus Sumerlaeia bacterium]
MNRIGILCALLVSIVPVGGFAQSGGPFKLRGSTIHSGAGISSGGSFSLSDSLAGPTSGFSSGGDFELSGGYLGPVDFSPPESAASATNLTRAAGILDGTFTANDGAGIGVATVELFVRTPLNPWTSAGIVTGGTFDYQPTDGSGAYFFATRATDHFGNTPPAPEENGTGDVMILYNETENAPFTHGVVESGSYIFPMTDDISIVIIFDAGTTGGPITVSRTVGGSVPGGFDPGKLIGESLIITGNFSGGEATVAWNFDPDNALGIDGNLDMVFQFDGTTFVNQYPVSGTNPLTIGPITSFSDWYAGDASSDVDEWKLLND